MDLKTWDRIQAIHDCLLPGDHTRVIYFDFDEPKRAVTGTLSHVHLKANKERDLDSFGLLGWCTRSLEDNREMWEY